MKSIEVNLTQEEENKLLKEAKEELQYEFTQEKVKEYLAQKDLNIDYVLREYIGIYKRYHDLINENKKEFTNKDRLIISLYVLMYDKFN